MGSCESPAAPLRRDVIPSIQWTSRGGTGHNTVGLIPDVPAGLSPRRELLWDPRREPRDSSLHPEITKTAVGS